MADQFDTWRAMLANKTVTLSDGEPASGYYRLRRGDTWAPVAIWQDGETLYAMRGPDYLGPSEVWPAAAKNPVTYEAYAAAAEGNGWPDDPPALPVSSEPENPRAVMGDNATTGDPAEDLRVELSGEQELAKDFLAQPITSQEQADKVAVWSKRISGLRSRADSAFKAEKQPILDQARAVDDRWRWRDDADTLVKKLKGHLTPWLQKIQREEQERAQKAAAEAARLRAEAEALAATAPGENAAEQAHVAAEEALRAAQPVRTGAGRTGAKVSLRTVTEVVITDAPVLATFYASMQPMPPDLHEVLLKLARRNIAAGITPPGATKTEKQVAA